jgi:CDP-diacylglycerol--glycerol-3-phosphate 3-phosphatidyltransferase
MNTPKHNKVLPTSAQTSEPPSSSSSQTVIDELTFNTTPNILTLIRIAFVPVIVGLLFLRESRWDLAAALIFAAASITDYFDGYLARTQKVETIYGKLLDPLADKFLVVSSLITLQYLNRIHPIIVILLICRELAITGLRALASAEGVIISASASGKWKTALQMVAIGFIMAESSLFQIPLYSIGMILLYLSLGMSLWSAKDYVVGFFKGLQEARKLKTRERQLAREARRKTRAARLESKAKGLGTN